MSELRVAEIRRAVWERFEGIAPMRGEEIELGTIIVAVLEELQRHGFVDLVKGGVDSVEIDQ